MLGGAEQPWFKEETSQTWKAGSLVYGNASGNVAICTNASQQLDGVILGQAQTIGRNLSAAAAGSPTSPFMVRPIRPTDIFVANAYHTNGTQVTAQTDLYDIKGLYYVAATGLWHVDYVNAVEGATDSLGRVIIIGFPDYVDGVQNTIGDILGYVLVRFLAMSTASDGVPNQRILQYAS